MALDDWIGIAASGHSNHELARAPSLLGLPDDDALCSLASSGLFDLLMPVPVDDGQVREFAEGWPRVLVVEEKVPTLDLL